MMVCARNVGKTYDVGRPVLNNVSFLIEKGEFVFLVGASGAGKSTLIKMFLRETKQLDNTILTYEYPQEYNIGNEPYYPIQTQSNLDLYRKYVDEITIAYPKIILGGRLGLYKYLDMDKCIEEAFRLDI